MDLRAAARDVIESKGGIAKSADFVAAGIRAVDVVSLCNAGYLDRVRHGYYQMAEQNEATEEQMLVTLIPQGIVCVESALFYYGYSDFAPRKWSVAVPRTISRTKLDVDALPLQTYFVQQDLYELGKPPGTSMVLRCLYMTGSVQSAIASSIVPDWIQNCFQGTECLCKRSPKEPEQSFHIRKEAARL